MTVSGTLKLEIDLYALRARREPLFLKACSGEVSPGAIAYYLESLRLLLSRTVCNLSAARDSAQRQGLPALAAYYERKACEEVGHDDWALSDLAELERHFSVGDELVPAKTIQELVDFHEQVVTQDPTRYLAYVLMAEYFTVLMGPEWIDVLTRKCNIPEAALTVISRHVELDKDHVVEGCQEIDALVDESDLPALRETMYRSMGYLSQFFADVGTRA